MFTLYGIRSIKYFSIEFTVSSAINAVALASATNSGLGTPCSASVLAGVVYLLLSLVTSPQLQI